MHFILLEHMNREMLIEHLTQAERHVAQGERILEHQRGVIEHIRTALYDSRMLALAESLLHTFEELQELHVADAARLRRDLEALREPAASTSDVTEAA